MKHKALFMESEFVRDIRKVHSKYRLLINGGILCPKSLLIESVTEWPIVVSGALLLA